MNLGLVITEKHTKLRGLLVLKQKKGKERDRRRIKFKWWRDGDGRTCIYKGGGEIFENFEGDLRKYGENLRKI